jgi:hypothetical protein
MSNYAENLLLNYLLNTSAVTRPTAWYVQLHMSDPTDTGTAGTQPTITSGDYDRKTLGASGMSTATTGSCSNPAAVSWTANAAAATYTFTHISIWDAVTAGNMLISGALALPETVAASGVLTLSIGKILATLE